MVQQGSPELLHDPVAEKLLGSTIPARLAYTWMGGTPRVVPVWFHWTGEQFVLGSPARAPKLKALAANPHVALTIDDHEWPYSVLMVRGTAEVEMLDDVVPEYATSTCDDIIAACEDRGRGSVMGRMPRIATRGVPAGKAVLSGDEVELVAFDVSKGCPAGSDALNVAQPVGAEAQHAPGFGVEGIGDEVEVEAVLDGLGLWYLLECDRRAGGGIVADEQDGVLGGGAFGDLPVQDSTPETGQCSGVIAVDCNAEKDGGHGLRFLSRAASKSADRAIHSIRRLRSPPRQAIGRLRATQPNLPFTITAHPWRG